MKRGSLDEGSGFEGAGVGRRWRDGSGGNFMVVICRCRRGYIGVPRKTSWGQQGSPGGNGLRKS